MLGAREFLAKVLPWEQQGEGVYFNLHWSKPNTDGKTGAPIRWWDGRACSTIDEMIKWLVFFGKDAARDFYVCMSTQNRCEPKTSKTNRPYDKAIRFSENVVGLKSFYIDIDVKPEAYPTQQEAIDALRLFVAALDLPDPSIVVSSGGGGFHAHWVVDCVLDRATWQPIANALAAATQKLGLICDTQCTIDSARILRIPGTVNNKYNPPRPVTLLSNGDICSYEDFRSCLEEYINLAPIKSAPAQFPFPRREPTIEGSELASGVVIFEGNRPKLEDVVEECPFMGDAWAEGGSDYNNPQWYMSLQVASWLEDSREAAHKISLGHPSYSAEETDQTFERIVREHDMKKIGWPSCQKIQASGATQCATCPHLSKGKSPLNFAKVEAPKLAVTMDLPGSPSIKDVLPENYTVGADALMYYQLINEQGITQNVKVCPYKIHSGWLQDSPWKLHFTSVTSLGKEAKIEVIMADFGGMGGVRKTLSAQGMVLNERDAKSTQEFLLAWVQKLQQQKNAVVASTPFGWVTSDEGITEGFAYGGRVWGEGVDRPAPISDPVISKRYSPLGKIQPWIDACKLITNQKRPTLDAIVAASFAAPLMGYAGYPGALVAAFSNGTGIGKTSAALVGIAVWGDPQRNKHGLSDTGNAIFSEMGRVKSLPIYWDELQEAHQVKAFGKFIFSLSGGGEKARLRRDGSTAERGVWNTLMVSTANYSLFDTIVEEAKSHNAGLARMFELEVLPAPPGTPGQIEPGVFARKIKELETNFGGAGLMFAQFLGANAARVKIEVGEAQDYYVKKVGQQEVERLWVAVIASMMVAARYANELNLTEFDLPGLEQSLLATLARMRQLVAHSPADMTNKESVANILAQFLNAMRARNTLETNKVSTGGGKPAKGAITVYSDMSKLDSVYVQIGRDDHAMRISYSYLGKWLALNNQPRAPFIRALEELFGFKRCNGIMASGTPASTRTSEYFLEVNTASPLLLGYIEV